MAKVEIHAWYRQYRKLKEQAADAILLFRFGDFYETFDDDAKLVAELVRQLGDDLHALCHVTGGGVTENLPRVLGKEQLAHVDGNYARGTVFELIRKLGPVDTDEMRRTFNLGVGLIAVVSQARADDALTHLAERGEVAWKLGEVEPHPGGEPVVKYR